MKRALAALLVSPWLALAAHAATLADRSVFTQGHWWNEARPGSGFELMHANGQAMLIWYTYEAGGRATWYTAQGEVASLGQAWPLQKHRWVNGRKEAAETVGNVRLKMQSPE